jgi:hypothetical protein
MGILKTRKNKKFGYEPRYYKSTKEGSPFEMEHKFDKYRKTVGNTNGWKTKFENAIQDLREGSDRRGRLTLVVIILGLVLVFLYIIDFDLTIFT